MHAMKIRFYITIFCTFFTVFLGASAHAVDLKDESITPTETKVSDDKQWFDRFDIGGFASAGYIRGEKPNKHQNGKFVIREASLFFEAEVVENTYFHLEWQAVRLVSEESKVAGQTAEAYLHLKNVLKGTGDDLLGIKVGRMDIPFGEEYLWQDAIDNPLITPSVAWPYGWDEGVLLYGHLGGLGWVASVSDGDDDRTNDESLSKTVNLKIYGNPLNSLYLSASYMKNDSATESAMELAGSHFVPVTTTTLPIETDLVDVSFKYEPSPVFRLWGSVGQAQITDNNPTDNRKINYYFIEPKYHFTNEFFGVARYSAIGTFSNTQGYYFDGKPYSDGKTAYGKEAKSLSRSSIGLGYWLNPKTVLKTEVSSDNFALIDGSTLATAKKLDRMFYAIELAVKF